MTLTGGDKEHWLAARRHACAAAEDRAISWCFQQHLDSHGRLNVSALLKSIETERLRATSAACVDAFGSLIECMKKQKAIAPQAHLMRDTTGSDQNGEFAARILALTAIGLESALRQANLSPPENLVGHIMSAVEHKAVWRMMREGKGPKRAACRATEVFFASVGSGGARLGWKTIERAYDRYFQAASSDISLAQAVFSVTLPPTDPPRR